MACIPDPKASKWAEVFVKLNWEIRLYFLKEIRSREKVCLVCENTEWKGCIQACSLDFASVRPPHLEGTRGLESSKGQRRG